jgi:HSP20 family protein
MKMTVVKWTPARRTTAAPFGAIGRDVERVFDDFFSLVPAASREVIPHFWAHEAYVPYMDVKETDTDYAVDLYVPGYDRAELNAEVAGTTLNVWGKKEAKEEVEGECYVRRESNYGSFCREVELPGEALEEGREAKLHDGILTIMLKKRAPMMTEAAKLEIT